MDTKHRLLPFGMTYNYFKCPACVHAPVQTFRSGRSTRDRESILSQSILLIRHIIVVFYKKNPAIVYRTNRAETLILCTSIPIGVNEEMSLEHKHLYKYILHFREHPYITRILILTPYPILITKIYNYRNFYEVKCSLGVLTDFW